MVIIIGCLKLGTILREHKMTNILIEFNLSVNVPLRLLSYVLHSL